MASTSRTAPSLRYRLTAEHMGVALRLIGEWIDLAAYYEGSDGNAWDYSASTGRFSNAGAIAEFRETFAQRRRGALFAEFEVDGGRCSLGELLAANADDNALCEWARGALVGDSFPAITECKRVA